MSSVLTLQINYHDIAIVPETIMSACANLFSEHYGVWQHNKKHVRMSSYKLRSEYLSNTNCRLAYADDPITGEIIGHVFYTIFHVDGLGLVIWITQLVVHTQYRNKGIARTLLGDVIHHKAAAVGLVSSHPYAVKSLESISNLECIPKITNTYIREIIKASNIKYLQDAELVCDDYLSLIDTHFLVDHDEINSIISKINWKMGHLPDGYEFIALVVK